MWENEQIGALDIFKNRNSSMKKACEEKETKGLMKWSKVHGTWGNKDRFWWVRDLCSLKSEGVKPELKAERHWKKTEMQAGVIVRILKSTFNTLN